MIKLLIQSEHRNFQRLWLAQLISQFGDRIHQLALVGLIAERSPGSAADLAKLMAFTIIPVFLIQPFAGVLVDRWDRRHTLFVCDILRGGLVFLIPCVFIFWESMVPIYLTVFLIFCFSRFYLPAKMSIIPDLVAEGQLLMANSLVSTTGMIAFVLGCAFGGVLVDRFGARTGFIIDGFTFLVSAFCVFTIDFPRKLKGMKARLVPAGKEIVGPIRKSVWMELKEGFHYLRQHKEVRFIINMLFILLGAAGAVYVVIIVFIQQAFGSVTRDLGLLALCLGVGLFLGAVCYGHWGRRFVWYKTIFFCLIVGGLILTLFALSVSSHPHLGTAVVLAFLLGLITGPVFIAANTIIHLVSDAAMRGKVFSALEMVIHCAFLIFMLASSWLAQFIDEVWILTGVGVIFSCVGLIGFQLKPKFVQLAEH